MKLGRRDPKRLESTVGMGKLFNSHFITLNSMPHFLCRFGWAFLFTLSLALWNQAPSFSRPLNVPQTWFQFLQTAR